VDAGAYGLTVMMAGVIAALRGPEAPELPHQAAPAHSLHLPQHESSSFRFCTNFAVTGTALDGQTFAEALERIGDSVLVVGDDRTIRVHVHTDDPEAATAVFEGAGEIARLDVADMAEQVADRTARLGGETSVAIPPAQCSVVAVALGAGLTRLFRELGASVVGGGPKMNPSTYELLAAIHASDSEEVLVLPNSPNVAMAAERAAELAEKPVRVVRTRAPQEGLAALLAFDPALSADENATAVANAAASLRLGGVAQSARTDPQGRFSRGDAVGYSSSELVAWGEPEETLKATLEHVARGAELVTCIAGEGAPLPRETIEAALPDGVELELHDGGQPAWWWLLCAE
jgi:dihydroxyacetone kinase-like predicted kinase